jgi:CHAT domain-containing protein
VTLSACETALTDRPSLTDEYQGLPAGFLYAGASAVVGTLWSVSDLATSILMRLFYSELLGRGPGREQTMSSTSVAEALRRAQRMLREMTASELRETWLTAEAVMHVAEGQRPLLEYFSKLPEEMRPFADVEWWAGACAIGHVL